jgi:hypothetical protein
MELCTLNPRRPDCACPASGCDRHLPAGSRAYRLANESGPTRKPLNARSVMVRLEDQLCR